MNVRSQPSRRRLLSLPFAQARLLLDIPVDRKNVGSRCGQCLFPTPNCLARCPLPADRRGCPLSDPEPWTAHDPVWTVRMNSVRVAQCGGIADIKTNQISGKAATTQPGCRIAARRRRPPITASPAIGSASNREWSPTAPARKLPPPFPAFQSWATVCFLYRGRSLKAAFEP